MYELTQQAFTTPRGSHVLMWVRADTNDFNTLNSCLTEDEYGLRDLHLPMGAWALDVGAYTGGVAIALAVDNLEVNVVAVEPVPGNLELLRRNIEANDLQEWITVVDGAMGDGSEVNIRYGYSGSELATHHAFVGNMSLIADPAPDNPHEVRRLRSRLLVELGHNFSFIKVDCEGCEWDLDFSEFRLIRGEWHPTKGHTQADVLSLLPGHTVTFSGPVDGPGGFEAVLR